MSSNRLAASWSAGFVLATCMTLMSLGIVELATRMVGHTDEDGNFYVGHRQALPLHLPVDRLEATVRQYRESSKSLFMEDTRLGWKPMPLARNALYAYNSAGLRSRTPEDVVLAAGTNTLRIAIFGDSFAHGSEVAFDESWGAQIQRALDRPDRRVEVLNFGVPGYGMDQAFLRWQEDGRRYRPDVVIFGLQLENAGRNLNLLRVLYDAADLPFAKPRFVESPNGLDLVNVPVPGPEEVIRIVRSIESWPLARHERYYERDSYRDRPWRRSRVIGILEGLIADRARAQRDSVVPEDARRLALKIIDRFARSVEESGARFVAVHFPRRADLERVQAEGRLPDLDFVETVSLRTPVVRIDRALLDRAKGGKLAPLFRPGGHYSAEGNVLIADAVVGSLQFDGMSVAQAGARTARVH